MGSSAKSNEGLHILFASPEVAPFFHSPLAELSRQLPAELRRQGAKVSIVTPYDPRINPTDHRLAERLTVLELDFDGRHVELKVLEGRTSEGVRIFFLRNDELLSPTGHYDPALRAGLFSQAICAFVDKMAIAVDIIHTIGWQTGLVPVYLEERYADSTKLASVTVFSTIADIADQGNFPLSLLPRLGLRESLNHPDDLEFYGQLSFLKASILYSDLLGTLSPHYQEAILTAEAGQRLDGVLRKRAEDLQSVVLGINERENDPQTEPALVANFSADKLNPKQQCKAAIQKELGLPLRPKKPLLLFLGPLSEARGLDLVSDILDDLMDREVQLVFLGTGEPHYERAVRTWKDEFPKNIAIHAEDDALTRRRFLAAADMLLLPAAQLPFDQHHLIARRFGAIPVARRISSYADSLRPIQGNEGNAFLFEGFDPDAFYDVAMDAIDAYESEERWLALVQASMKDVPTSASTAEGLIAAYQLLL
ncbi:MAG: glycogen/starch synthase [Myxococcota bacterium]|jgi:starch synthase|nr:glycogen/starch synthase [Myxococcota bacterium]